MLHRLSIFLCPFDFELGYKLVTHLGPECVHTFDHIYLVKHTYFQQVRFKYRHKIHLTIKVNSFDKLK